MIRSSTTQDYPKLLDIQLSCVGNLTETYSKDDIRKWSNYLQKEGSVRYAKFHNLVLEQDGQIEGFVSWASSENNATIECLYVTYHAQGKGLGKILLTAAESHLKDKTVRIRSSLNAVSFYEKHGYEAAEKTKSRAGFDITVLTKQL